MTIDTEDTDTQCKDHVRQAQVTFVDAPQRNHPYVVLGAVCLAALVLPLSFAGAAVATPAIGLDLGGSPLALNWVTNAFMLSFGSFLMAAGALADAFGRKRLFTIGIALFSIISLALGLAPNILWLDVLRAAQGIAAAAALSGGSAALAQEFDGRARTQAFSVLGTTFGVGLAFGPILAGLLLDRYGWRSIFLSGAIIGSLALLFGVPRMRESRDPNAAGLDWPGTLSFTGMLALFTWGVLQGPDSGWSSPLVIGLLVGAVIFLMLFVMTELLTTQPMLDLTLFRYPRFIGVQVLPIATGYCFVVLLVLLPVRFIGIEGHSAIKAGLTMIALSAPMLIVPSISASLTRWISAGVLSGIGLLIASAGLFLMSRVVAGQTSQAIILPMVVIGVGAGLPWGLMDGLSVSVVPKERAGMATGIFSTTRVAGEGIAIAIVGALLAALIQGGLSHRLGGTAAGASHIAMATQCLETGDMAHALRLLPGVSRSSLTEAYVNAFRKLLYVLIAITLLSALTVFGFLGGARKAPGGLDLDPWVGPPDGTQSHPHDDADVGRYFTDI
jgi:MFS family permease